MEIEKFPETMPFHPRFYVEYKFIKNIQFLHLLYGILIHMSEILALIVLSLFVHDCGSFGN